MASGDWRCKATSPVSKVQNLPARRPSAMHSLPTHINYAKTMAFIALDETTGEILGVA
jgi:hypothetical protein